MSNSSWRISLVIALLALAVYLNSIPNGFMPDDELIIWKNEWIRTGGGLGKLLTRDYFEVSGERTYRAAATLFYYVEYRLWGDWAPGYHLVSVMLHAVSSALLYHVLARLLQNCAHHTTTGRFLALWSALLFAVHPANTEAVAAIGYREDVLALAAMLAAWLCSIRAEEGSWLRAIWVGLASLMFLLSIMAKEITVGFPLLMVAGDMLRGRQIRARWSAYLPFITVAAAFIPFRLWLTRTTFEGSLPYTEGTFSRQMLLTPIILMHYLRILLFPTRLSGDYEFHFRGFGDAEFLLAIVCGGAALFAAICLIRRSRVAGFGIIWFGLLLGPAFNIMPMVNPMAERYLYAPGPGFCLLLAVLLGRLWEARPRSAVGLAMMMAVSLASLTIAHNPVWGSDRIRNAETVRYYPTFARPHLSLGAVYEAQGLLDLAEVEYVRATSLAPKSGRAHSYRANLLMRKGELDQAIGVLRRAAQAEPHSVRVWLSLARAYALKGDRAKSEAAAGWALHVEGREEAALERLERAHKLAPDDPSVLVPLAFVQEAAGRRDAAAQSWERLLELHPEATIAREALQRLRSLPHR